MSMFNSLLVNGCLLQFMVIFRKSVNCVRIFGEFIIYYSGV